MADSYTSKIKIKVSDNNPLPKDGSFKPFFNEQLNSIVSDYLKGVNNLPTTQRKKEVSVDFGRLMSPSKNPLLSFENLTGKRATFKPGEPIQKTETEYSDIQEGQKFKPGSEFEKTVTPSIESKYANLPQMFGSGQYTVDPKQKGQLIKAERIDDSTERILLRNGLSPSHYQVDHIVPLWAGGSDTLANKQIIPISQHNRKTKAQAVPMELYYAGKIGLADARNAAINWQDKDIEGIKLDKTGRIVDENGNPNIGIAEQKYKEWKQPEKVGFMDWFKQLGEEKTWEKVAPSPLIEFSKGLADEMAFGYLGAKPSDEYQGIDDKGLGRSKAVDIADDIGFFLGKTAGTIASFMMLGGAVSKIAGKLGIKALAPKAMKTMLKDGKFVTKTSKLPNILKDAGLFSAHGQLHKQEPDKGRMERFLMDVAYGGLLGGAGHTLKGYGKVGGGTMMLSMLEGASPEEALMNTAVVVGLHGTGHATGKRGRKNLAKNLDDEATKEAIKIRNEYLGKKSPKKTPKKEGFNLNEIINENEQIFNKIGKLQKEGVFSLEQAAKERAKVYISGRQLYKRGLGREQRLKEEIADMMSIGRKVKNQDYNLGNISTPPELISFIKSNPDVLSDIKVGNISAKGINFPTGPIPVTGLGKKTSKETANNVRKYLEAIKKGKASRKVFLVDRPEIEPIIRKINNSVDEKEIAQKLFKPYENPQNNIQVYGIVDGRPISLGWLPREFRLDHKQSKFGINRNAFDSQGNVIPGRDVYDIKFNKDKIAPLMREKGVKVLTADLKTAIPETAAGESFIALNIGNNNWQESIARARRSAKFQKGKDSVPQIINRFKTLKNSKDIQASIKELQQKTTIDTPELLSNLDIGNPYGKSGLASFLNIFSSNFKKGSASSLYDDIQKNIGDVINEQEAIRIFNNKNNFTVGNAIDLASKNNKKLNKSGLSLMNLIGTLTKDSKYLNHPVKKVLYEMPIINATNKASGLDLSKVRKIRPEKSVVTQEKLPLEVKPGKTVKTTPKSEKVSPVTQPDTIKRMATKEAVTKADYANRLYKQGYEDVRLMLDDMVSGSQGLGTLSRQQFIKRANNIIDSVKIDNVKGASKDFKLSNQDISKIKSQIKDDIIPYVERLVYSKFDPVNEVNFGDIRQWFGADEMKNLQNLSEKEIKDLAIKRLKEDTRKRLGINLKDKFSGITGATKNALDVLKEKQAREAGKWEAFGKIFEKVGKAKEMGVTKEQMSKYGFAPTGVKNFAETIKGNVKNANKKSYSYGYSKTFDEGMKEIFGKNYDTNWSLNPFFNLSSTKGKNYWINKMYNTLNKNYKGISQPKDVAARTYELLVEKKKPYSKWTDADRKYVFGRRKEEVAKKAGAEMKEKLKTPQKEDLGYGFGVEGGLEEQMISDMTSLDMLSPGRVAANHTGKSLNAKAGAEDARMQIWSLFKDYNASAKKKVGVKNLDKKLDDIIENITKEASSLKNQAGFTGIKSLAGLGLGSAAIALWMKDKSKEDIEKYDIDSLKKELKEFRKTFKIPEEKKGIATYYNPVKAQTDESPNTGGLMRKMEFGDIAIGNRKEYDDAKKAIKEGKEMYVFIPELKPIETPYGEGIFRVNDTMNIRYDGKNKVDIFIPPDKEELQKDIGNKSIKYITFIK